MKDYICVTVTPTPYSEDACDLLAAMLGDIGFDSFTSSGAGMKAYIIRDGFSASALEACLDEFPMPGVQLHSGIELIEGEDWNSEWERHYFKPIVVGGRCVVHSSFHTDIPKAEYDITVDPKMAFGTGHHSTTSLMLEYLLDTPLKGVKVTDMGTGTGILAILACMRGAEEINGIEIDPDAADNARENISLNGVGKVNIITGDASALSQTGCADIFLANINRNIITGDISRYADALNPGGKLVVSGFYSEDIPVIEAAANAVGLVKESEKSADDNWSRVVFIKPANG